MDKKILHKRLKKIFMEVLGTDSMDDEMSVDTVPQWESINHVALLIECQEAFGVVISPSDIDQTTTVANLKALILEKKS